MKAPSKINLPTVTGDVIVNPENPVNPDSKTISYSARIFLGRRQTIVDLEVKVICSRLLSLVLNQDFEDYRGLLRYGCQGHS